MPCKLFQNILSRLATGWPNLFLVLLGPLSTPSLVSDFYFSLENHPARHHLNFQ